MNRGDRIPPVDGLFLKTLIEDGGARWRSTCQSCSTCLAPNLPAPARLFGCSLWATSLAALPPPLSNCVSQFKSPKSIVAHAEETQGVVQRQQGVRRIRAQADEAKSTFRVWWRSCRWQEEEGEGLLQ